jgi:glycosyltransferase involved in cell wall biosynthesis
LTTLRVAYVLGTASGGTALHAGMLAEGCRRAGLSVVILGPASTRDAVAAGAAGLPSDTRPPDATGEAEPGDAGGLAGRSAFKIVEISDRPRPARDLAAVARLRGLLRGARPDVVHAHGLRAGAFAALALLFTRGARRPRLAVTVHNAPPRGRQARLAYGVLEVICARRADAVLCASADLTDRMRRLGAAGAATFDVPAPLAPAPSAEAVARARADLGAGGRLVVLAVGRLAEQKGLDTLLAAAARWRQGQAPAPRLVIAGDGPLADELTATAVRTGVDLLLLGQRDDVPALLAAADVVAVPSRWEARALVVQEAMRAGRPVVASRVGGIPDLTGEDAALLVPPGDAGRLADAVLEVLTDPRLAARLSAAALRRAAVLPSQADAVTAALAVYSRLCGRA